MGQAASNDRTRRRLLFNTIVRLGTQPFWVRAILAVTAGAIIGLGVFTFVYAEGFSYVGSDPQICVNCHVMRGAYEGWNHSSHKAVARCVDCHAPHNPFEKYAVKGINGAKDMVAFTLSMIPDPINIRPFNRMIVENSCIECHGEVAQPISHEADDHPTDCLRCHASIGHDY